ncbi:mechanosensitive ion channel family protein [candidate division KSB1 bacterium]|nr:mechanosensitive ion channel family protein [candidate division KSB1 bacterium]
MTALLLCFYAIPAAQFLLDSEFRYLLVILSVIILTIFFQRLVRFGLGRYLRKSAVNLKMDPTAFNFLKNAINMIILLIASFFIFYSIPALRAIGATLLASAGIIAAVAAFASQHALANIVSGVFIVIFKPFRVDDMIEIGADISGKVEDITLRHTVIRNFENRRVIIPNSTINSETIVNSHLVEEKICIHLEVGISYDSDIDRAMVIMQTVSERHALCLDNRDDEKKAENRPIVNVRVIALTDSAVILRAWVWARNADDAFVMKCDLLKLVKEEFDRQGVEIPFPHRTLVYKKDVLDERSRLMERSPDENKT